MDEWKAIEPGVWKPQKEGDQIVGVLLYKEERDDARRLSARYLLENETGKLLVWGSAVIDDRMRHVNIGDKIRITYQGKTKNKRSQDVLLYRIEVSRDPVGGNGGETGNGSRDGEPIAEEEVVDLFRPLIEKHELQKQIDGLPTGSV